MQSHPEDYHSLLSQQSNYTEHPDPILLQNNIDIQLIPIQKFETEYDGLSEFMAESLFNIYRDPNLLNMDVSETAFRKITQENDDALSVASASTMSATETNQYSSRQLLCEMIKCALAEKQYREHDANYSSASTNALIETVELGRPNNTIRVPMMVYVAQLCFPTLLNNELDEQALRNCSEYQIAEEDELSILIFLAVLLQHLWPEELSSSSDTATTTAAEEYFLEPFGQLPCTRSTMAEWVVRKFCNIVDMMQLLGASSACWERFFVGLQHYIPRSGADAMGGPSRLAFGKILGYQVAFYTCECPAANEVMHARLCLVNSLLGPECLAVRYGRSVYAPRPAVYSTPRMVFLSHDNIQNIMAFVGVWMPMLTGPVAITGSCLFNIFTKSPPPEESQTLEQRSNFYAREIDDADVNITIRRHYTSVEGDRKVSKATLTFVRNLIRQISKQYPGPVYKIEQKLGLYKHYFRVASSNWSSRWLSLSLLDTDSEGADHSTCATCFTHEGFIIPLVNSSLFSQPTENKKKTRKTLRPCSAIFKKKTRKAEETDSDSDSDNDDDHDETTIPNRGEIRQRIKFGSDTQNSTTYLQSKLEEKLEKTRASFAKSQATQQQKYRNGLKTLQNRQQSVSEPRFYAFVTNNLFYRLTQKHFSFDKQDRAITNRVQLRLRDYPDYTFDSLYHNMCFPRIIPKPISGEESLLSYRDDTEVLRNRFTTMMTTTATTTNKNKKGTRNKNAPKLNKEIPYSNSTIKAEEDALSHRNARVRAVNIAEVVLCNLACDDHRDHVAPIQIQVPSN